MLFRYIRLDFQKEDLSAYLKTLKLPKNFNFYLEHEGQKQRKTFQKRFSKISGKVDKYKSSNYDYLPKYTFILRENRSDQNVLRISVRKNTIIHDDKNHQNPFPENEYWQTYLHRKLEGSILTIGDFNYHFNLRDFLDESCDEYNLEKTFTIFCKLTRIILSDETPNLFSLNS